MSNSNRNTRQNTGLSRGAKKVLDDPDLVANIQAFAGQHQVSEQTLAQLESRAPTKTDRIPDGKYREPGLMITEFLRLLREQQATGRAPELSDVCCSPDGYCTYFLFDNGSAWQAKVSPPHPVRVPHLIDQHVTAIASVSYTHLTLPTMIRV